MDEKRIFQVVFLANLAILGIILAGVLLWVSRSLVTPTLSAMLVAYLLFPILTRCSKIGLPRWLGVTMVIAILGLILSFTVSVILPIITEEVGRFQAESTAHLPTIPEQEPEPIAPAANTDAIIVLPAPPPVVPADDGAKARVKRVASATSAHSQSTLLNIIQQLSAELKDRGLIKEEWRPDEIRIALNNWIASRGQELIAIVSNKAIQLGTFLIIFTFVLIFSLLEGDRFYKILVSSLPNGMYEGGVYIINSTTKMFGAYIRGVAIETIILGVICLALSLPLMIVFKELSLLIVLFVTMIISLTNVVRIVGPIFGALAGAVLTFSSTSNLKAAVAILAVAGIVQIFDNALVLPLVMEGQMEIHPVLCMLGVLAGGIIGGVLGMILAIPVIGGVKVLIRVLSVELHKFNYGSKPYYIYQPPKKV